jgi:hypothetical protein
MATLPLIMIHVVAGAWSSEMYEADVIRRLWTRGLQDDPDVYGKVPRPVARLTTNRILHKTTSAPHPALPLYMFYIFFGDAHACKPDAKV